MTADERNDDQADRQVDPEDPLPSKTLGDCAASNGAGNEGQSGHGAEYAQRLGTFLARECRAQKRHRQRHDQRRTGALNRARGDQRADVAGQCTRRRGHDEQGDAGREHAAAPQAVAERRAGEQQHGEAQVIGIDRPLQRFNRSAKINPDRTQRRRDHQCVERDHERRHRCQCQHPGLRNPSLARRFAHVLHDPLLGQKWLIAGAGGHCDPLGPRH